MAEWLKALVSKTNKGNTFGGSNPPFSVFFNFYICFLFFLCYYLTVGEMAEWLKAPVLKTDEGNTSGGSNPSFSVKFYFKYVL